MKRFYLFSMVLIVFLFFGCSSGVSKQNPIVISENSVVLSDGQNVSLNLEMISGSKHEGEIGGGIYECNWKGLYQIHVFSDERDISIVPVAINEAQMNFGEKFELVFDDYNGDLNPDFTLGQYGSLNGNIFRLFTVFSNGEIKELECGDSNAKPIASKAFSVKLEKINDNSFILPAYDVEKAEIIETVYTWNDDKFVVE